MERVVMPESLDELPADDPRALRSRGDLRRLNTIMGHAGLIACGLLDGSGGASPRRVVELGAGDGTFFLALARRLLPTWKSFEAVLVDRVDIVSQETRDELHALGCRCQCVEADVFDWLAGEGAKAGDCMVANLFLHHFSDERLRTLLSLVAERAECFAACETRRSWPVLMLSRMLGLIGCNDVTRHDAVLSVQAGFRGRELSSLWHERLLSGWVSVEGNAGLFSHRFVARRCEPGKV